MQHEHSWFRSDFAQLQVETNASHALELQTALFMILCHALISCVLSYAQVAAATVGLEQFGQMYVPALEADPAVTAFLQGSTLMSSTAASLLLLKQTSGQAWSSILPHATAMLLFSAELWYLIV